MTFARETTAAVSPLALAPFRRIVAARALTGIAFQMQAVAIGWQLYLLTGNALDLGLVGLAQFGPMFLLTLPAGQLADRIDRRRIIATCQTVGALTALALAFCSATGSLDRALLFSLVVIAGAARAFEFPAMSATLPLCVPREALGRATALYSSANQTATILGPALGGLIYARYGPVAVYITDALLLLVAAALVVGLVIDSGERRREPITLATVFAGVGFIRGQPVILGCIALDLFAVLLGSTTALLPVFARDVLHTDASGLGLLRAAPAAGALGLSLVLARTSINRHAGRALFGAVAGFGLATVVFGLSGNLYLSLAALAVLGAADVVSVVIRLSLVQLRTPDDMRGRVSAVNALFIQSSNQLGDFRAGLAASAFGAVPAVVLGGLSAIAVAGLWMALFPQLRRLQKLS